MIRDVLSGNLDSLVQINVYRSVKRSTRLRTPEMLGGLVRRQSVFSATSDLPLNRQRAFIQVQQIIVAGDRYLHSRAALVTDSMRKTRPIGSTGGTHPCFVIRDLPIQRLDIAVECHDHDYDQDQDKEYDDG